MYQPQKSQGCERLHYDAKKLQIKCIESFSKI